MIVDEWKLVKKLEIITVRLDIYFFKIEREYSPMMFDRGKQIFKGVFIT